MTIRRRSAVALFGATAFSIGAQVPGWSLEAQRRLAGEAGPGSSAARSELERLAQDGEAALARCDAEAAQRAFDRAAALVHSPDVEMGLVRTHMQAGDYRRALAFAAHAAGAHRDLPAGTALYVWLLHIGGQGQVARRMLDDAVAQWPGDAALLQMALLLAAPLPLPAGELMAAPMRAAPYAVPALPWDCQVAGTAWLLGDDGLRAVVPAATVASARTVWLRNAMGMTVAAEPLAQPQGTGLALLRLASPLPSVPGLQASASAPFAGSPAYAIEYVEGPDATPAWPLLRQGFFGRVLAMPEDRLLGLVLPPGPRGGPVFDAFGRVAGLAVPGIDGRDRLLPIDNLVRRLSLSLPAATVAAPQRPADRIAMDLLYEVGMRVSLQVLVRG